MTIKELYQWAKINNMEDAELFIQNGDDGGYYPGDRAVDTTVSKVEENKVILDG